MTAQQLAQALATQINALNTDVIAAVDGTRIFLFAKQTGANSILDTAELTVDGVRVDFGTFFGGSSGGTRVLNVSPSSLSFEPEGGTEELQITTDDKWAVSATEITPSPDDDHTLSITRNVYNLADEGDKLQRIIHLQSRPITFDFGYAHIHRIVSMVRAILAENSSLTVSLYGSENLTDWRLLSYAHRRGQGTNGLRVSQIRTPSAARAWRYYTIVAGGYATPDTDFGPFLLDYQPTIRRVG